MNSSCNGYMKWKISFKSDEEYLMDRFLTSNTAESDWLVKLKIKPIKILIIFMKSYACCK